MFFYTYDGKPNSPTAPMTDALVQARKRGVDVAVLLDRDAADDVYGSRKVNKAIYKALAATKIKVRFDQRTRLLHSKLVIVDGKHVVVGSHNWTAGSIFQYEDLSCYVRSNELAAYYEKWFDEVWKESSKIASDKR
jgi:phosphatidylserine/phosphatidylglycerophosphate/cardiolipin synthase-like enzyme